jgi:hypothetical protein
MHHEVLQPCWYFERGSEETTRNLCPIGQYIYRPSVGCGTMKQREKRTTAKGRKGKERNTHGEREREKIVYLSVSMSCSLSCQSKWNRTESFLKSWEQDKLHFRSAVPWLVFLLHGQGYYIIVSCSAGPSPERKQDSYPCRLTCGSATLTHSVSDVIRTQFLHQRVNWINLQNPKSFDEGAEHSESLGL